MVINSIAVRHRDRQCIFLNNLCGQVLKVLEGHSDLVRAVAISAYGCTIVSGSDDKTTRIWSVESGEVWARCFVTLYSPASHGTPMFSYRLIRDSVPC